MTATALTPAERTLLILLASGRQLPELAVELGLKRVTLATYRSRILRKLGAFTIPEAAVNAERAGIIRRGEVTAQRPDVLALRLREVADLVGQALALHGAPAGVCVTCRTAAPCRTVQTLTGKPEHAAEVPQPRVAAAREAMLHEADRLGMRVTVRQVEALLSAATAHLEAPNRASKADRPAGLTHAALRAMLAAGWPVDWQMREAGLKGPQAYAILRQTRVQGSTERAVVGAATRLLGRDPVGAGVSRYQVVRARSRAADRGWSIDEFRLLVREAGGVEEESMTEEQFVQSRSEVVVELRYCGDAEQDHLLEEIQSPDSTEAFFEMPGRCRPEAA
jgi:DNA-binding CsgD family transcriptional regulator